VLNLKKEAEVVEIGEIKVTNCPICQSYVSHVYFMQDANTKKKSKWFACSCGIVFQDKLPTGTYDLKYWEAHSKYDKKRQASYEYPIRLYAPIIEELVYGRRVLIVGRQNTYFEDYFAERGWVPTVIDKNSALTTKGNVIAADFEQHKFPEVTKYSLIWMYHTLECFSDPVGSLELCKKLLAEDGIIFIGTPDTDFINTRSSSCFIHWKPDYNHIMWNRRSLTRHLDSLGFNVILSRQNYERRFPSWDDVHVLAQKKFF